MVTGIFFLLAFATVEGFALPPTVTRLLQSASTIVVFDESFECSEENLFGILEVSFVPVILIRGENLELYNYVHEDFVAVVLLSNISNQALDHVFASVKFLESSRVVFVLLNSVEDVEISSEILFRQCFANGFLNVLLLHNIYSNHTFQIYTFLPFRTLEITELTNVENAEDLFPDKLKNVYGYPIRTIFRDDYPRSYFYKAENGTERKGGYLSKMLLAFAEKYNASLQIVDTVNFFDKNKLISMIKTGEIDVAPNLILPTEVKTANSYPLSKINDLLVAPQLKKVPRFAYLLKPFDLPIWVTLGSFLLYAALAEGLVLILIFKNIDFGKAFMSVSLGIIYQAVGGRLFERWRFAIIHGQVLILGFILINFYLAILSSYLTVELYEKPPKTYSEIRESGMKIMAEKTSLSNYISFGGIPDGYEDLYFAVEVDELLTHVFSLNTSYMYGLSADRIYLLKIQQSRLRKPLLSPTNILITEFIANCPIYTFLPFRTLEITELTNVENAEDLFPDKLKNVYGYPIRTIFRDDYPRSYFYKAENGTERKGGYLSKMLLAFAEKYNASLQIVDTVNFFDKNKLISMIKTGEIDVAPNLILPTEVKTANSYPLSKINDLLVAPQLKKVPRFAYLLKPFDLPIWVTLGSFLLYAALAEGLVLILIFKNIDFGKAFMSVSLGIIYQAVGGRLFERWRFAIIHGQVLILGFILINFYLAILSSYLTVELYEKPPKTYSEIRESGMKIMAEKTSLSNYISFGGIPDGYEDLYFAVEVDELLTHVFSLNTSYMYGLSADRIYLLKIQQSRLRKPLLSPTNILITEFIANCPVICSWVLRYKFDEFIFRANNYGLIWKWYIDAFLERDQIDLKGYRTEYIEASTEAVPLNFDHMSFLWNCLVFGWCISCVTFIFEKFSFFFILLRRSIFRVMW
ncbi:unnamed protein product [Hermetia illucens]|uniref:Ionotropic receptor n=1 Tax=Hermetia illucens TaxID=343691 RepID=A0A7R8UBW1_HERIL|nr:unnamed protein product [Hermetia illucens]